VTDRARRVGFPPERRLVLDTLYLGRHKPMMHGLIEVDVTRALMGPGFADARAQGQS
jgi:hypothetical protein